MNFDEAIQSHSSWKMKLSRYLTQKDGSFDPATVSAPDRCDLGKWLKAELVAKSGDAILKELSTTHAQFHRAVGDVVIRANKGLDVTSEILLGAKSDFAKTSSRVVGLLLQLKSRKAA